jgi:uncharacterized protein
MMVLLDTVGLLALWDKSDQWHADAERVYWRVKESSIFVTTTFILAECGNAGARRPFRFAVAQLRLELENEEALIVPAVEDWNQGWEAYQVGKANSAGIVDHISFAVMRRLGVKQAFTNDQHFRAAGFETLF